MENEDQLRRRKAMQQALVTGLQRPPNTSSFMPGESAGIPTGIKLGGMERNAGLTLPQPNAPSLGMDSMPPTPSEPVTAIPSSPRIGYSTTGLTGTDALMQRRKALEEADPESKVTSTGEILPPQKTGRFKGLGQGIGLAAANADPDRPMYALGQMLGGGISGAVSPRGAAKGMRRFELGQLDNDLARGLKLEGVQADVGASDALRRQRELDPALQAAKIEQQREEANARLELEREKAAGTITQREYDRRQRELDRTSREKIAADRIVSSEKIAASRPSGEDTRGAKASAAQAEYDQLVADEVSAGEEKNRAYAYLEQLKSATGPDGKPLVNAQDVAQAVDAAQAADKVYQSFAEKKRDAQRRMRENAASSSRAPAAPAGVTEASIRADAKSRGANEDEAVKKARQFGWIP